MHPFYNCLTDSIFDEILNTPSDLFSHRNELICITSFVLQLYFMCAFFLSPSLASFTMHCFLFEIAVLYSIIRYTFIYLFWSTFTQITKAIQSIDSFSDPEISGLLSEPNSVLVHTITITTKMCNTPK